MAVVKKTAAGTVIEATNSTEHLTGTSGNETIYAAAGGGRIDGGGGSDHVYGRNGNDWIMRAQFAWGGDGNDRIFSSSANDELHGGKGNDEIYAIFGGLDRDVGHDVLFGDSGNDTIRLTTGNQEAYGGTGFDTLDMIHNDTGSGSGRVSESGMTVFWTEGEGVTVNLSKHTATGQHVYESHMKPGSTFSEVYQNKDAVVGSASSNHKVYGFEAVRGTNRADSITGDKLANFLRGEGGNDMLRGLGGADTLTGGKGDDTFVYLKKDVAGQAGIDHITDFTQGDKLDLHDFFKGHAGAAVGSMVHVADTAAGSVVSANVKGAFVTVAVLDYVHDMTAADMLANGMILT